MKNGPYELVIAPPGYPGKLYRGRYCYEHHLVWWQNTGEVPGPGEEIHHKNEHKRQNNFGNLEKIGGIPHRKLHGALKHAECARKVTCSKCNQIFVVKGSKYRRRVKQTKSGKLFCSRSCQVSDQQTIRWSKK